MWIALYQESFKDAHQSAILNVRLSNIIEDINEIKEIFQPWYIYDISIIGTTRQPNPTITNWTPFVTTRSKLTINKKLKKSPNRYMNPCVKMIFEEMSKKHPHFQHTRIKIHCIIHSSRLWMRTITY